MTYIEEHREEFGVEPICRVLQVAPSTYYAARSRLPSARQLRDAVLMPIMLASGLPTMRCMGSESCGRRWCGPATLSDGTRPPG